LRAANLPVEEIRLVDVDPERLAVIAAVLADDAVRTTTDLGTGLRGADVVFSAIRPGGNDARVADERISIALGLIGQETVGAGGIRSALRCVPVVVGLAEAIARHAPDAWVVSMTNPAGVVVEAMGPILGDRVLGVCDSPLGLIRRAAVAAGLVSDAATLDLSGLDVDYVGLNHLGWLRRLSAAAGSDRLPDLVADPDRLARFEEGRLFGPRLLSALGALPNEYLFYFYDAAGALAGIQSAPATRGELIRAAQHDFYAAAARTPTQAGSRWRAANSARNETYLAELRAPGEARAAIDVESGGYEGVAVAAAAALTGGRPARLVLNVPNGTTIPALPSDAVIETVARVDHRGAHPEPIRPLTVHQLGLMSIVKATEQDAIVAAIHGDRRAALRAFAEHPLVASAAAARALVDDWRTR
jgi:6-phospho-beta-glucosidase